MDIIIKRWCTRLIRCDNAINLQSALQSPTMHTKRMSERMTEREGEWQTGVCVLTMWMGAENMRVLWAMAKRTTDWNKSVYCLINEHPCGPCGHSTCLHLQWLAATSCNSTRLAACGNSISFLQQPSSTQMRSSLWGADTLTQHILAHTHTATHTHRVLAILATHICSTRFTRARRVSCLTLLYF